MGHTQSFRADGSPPATGRTPAEGLEDAFACGEEGWYVLYLFYEDWWCMDCIMICFVLAYYVAFGPHGPRSPVNPPGTTVKILTGVSALIGTAGLLYASFRSIGTLSFLLVYNNIKVSLSQKIIIPSQPRRHPRRSPRSGKRPATSAPRNSKSTPSQVRNLSSQLFIFPGP